VLHFSKRLAASYALVGPSSFQAVRHGHDFTAKDFRTWAGTVLAARELARTGPFKTAPQAKHLLAEAIRRVASRLGNTPAVCRKSHVHPAIVEAYLAGRIAEGCPDDDDTYEEAVLALLERWGETAQSPEG
jgi:DNA topoisomerase I